MSWSVSFSGTPAEIVQALNEEQYDGDSKTEYEAAKPHLVGLVEQNYAERKLELTAYGHGIEKRECSVTLKAATALLLIALLLLPSVAEAGCGVLGGVRARRTARVARRAERGAVMARVGACANPGTCR